MKMNEQEISSTMNNLWFIEVMIDNLVLWAWCYKKFEKLFVQKKKKPYEEPYVNKGNAA